LKIERSLNILYNVNTGIIPFEALYRYPAIYQLNNTFNLAETENFIENQETIRKDLKDSIELINAKIATYFDTVYRPL
jgi:cell division protein FtsL